MNYAATASDGSRSRGTTREEIDRWARMKCGIGCDVDIWTRDPHTEYRGVGSDPVRVGRWESVDGH